MNTEQQYPPIWRRFAAIIYDTLLVTAVSMAYGGVCIAIGVVLWGEQEALTSGVLFQLGWFILIIAFFCFFWTKSGQTLGMRAWRLAILQSKNAQLPTVLQCIKRCTLAPLGLALFFIGLLRKDKQCLHDLLSKTQVVLLTKDQ
jgi:uncharacterized RDD family membrane protein YckC